MLRSMKIQDLNSHILCVLCGGYLVDATTIVECLHSFCRSCIVKYLQASYHCPVCDVEVHKTKPLLNIRPDRTLQEIVFKLVPGLYQAELKLKQEFEEKQREENKSPEENEAANEITDKKEITMDDPVFITLEYYRRKRNLSENQIFPTRYLRCSSAMTVDVLRKFLVVKFAIPNTHQVEMIRSDEILDGHLTIREVSRMYGLYAKSFLDLEYAILEFPTTGEPSIPRKVKLDINPWKKIKIKRRKKRNKKLKQTMATELLPRNETVTESKSEQQSLQNNLDGLFLQNGETPSFPDTPPTVDDIPGLKNINSPV